MQVNTTDYHSSDRLTQFKLTSVHGDLYLLLKDSIPNDILEFLYLPEVQTELCLCWVNNDYGFRSEDIAPKWKGIAISQELARLALIALEEGNESRALHLLSVGNWIALTFKGMSNSPFISDGGNIVQF